MSDKPNKDFQQFLNDILPPRPWPIEEETNEDVAYFRRVSDALKEESRRLGESD